jgi:hypothetical protein
MKLSIFFVNRCKFQPIAFLLLLAGMHTNAQSFLQEGLKASYYNKPDFKDSVLTRKDATVNFNINKGFQVSGFNANNFSVKWLGYIVPEYSEAYTFTINATGYYKLYINDSLLVNNYSNNKNTQGSITLTKGIQYNFKLCYVNNSQPAMCIVKWESNSCANEIIPSKNLIPEDAGLPPVRIITNVIGRDPMVTLGPDGNYYLVQTSCYLNGKLSHQNAWDHNDGLHLWKSTNLRDWTNEGLVWSIEREGSWQKKYDDRARRPMWAPELHYIKSKKNWFVIYSMGTFGNIGIKTSLFKSKTGKPEGPYENVVEEPLINGIDGSLFEEDNGDVYLLHDNCQIAKMNSDMTGFVEPFRQLKTVEDKPVGFEGPGMIKLNNKYYLFSAQSNTDMGGNTYDLSVAVADNIYGPYTKSWIALRHGGHGTLFLDKQGNIWTSMFGSDDLSNVYITPALVQMALEFNGKILPLRGNARAKIILPAATINAVDWQFTTVSPPAGWNEVSIPAWPVGKAAFGKNGNTAWSSSDIWLRRSFNPGTLSRQERDNLLLYIQYNDSVEIYINGIKAADMQGGDKYSLKNIGNAAKKAIKPNKENVIAIHCHKQSDNQFVDAGLITWTDK